MGDVGFYDLATPLYDKVDWGVRAARGGDGAAPPYPSPYSNLKTVTLIPTLF